MSFEKAKEYLDNKGFGERVKHFDVSSATVELAAKAVGTEAARIAKSLTFKIDEKPIMIIAAGDVKIDNQKYKAHFSAKAKMLSPEEVDNFIGHSIGGVCPFGINDGVDVYLDESLKRFDVVYPACGDARSAVKLTPDELYSLANCKSWIDVCKLLEA
ncbi:MAG: YbaK/EbsC family protein [Clostridia bacterium]|nr:YbaK/EbsC family protein [Clostridia bacterium]